MNRLTFYIISIALICVSCNQTSKSSKTIEVANGTPVMEFRNDFHDFGTIVQGEIVAYSFNFINTGDGNLFIKDALPDCGCTRPDYPKSFIAPGDSAKIEIAFNSDGWRGSQYKQITFVTNAKRKKHTLTIKANVILNNNL